MPKMTKKVFQDKMKFLCRTIRIAGNCENVAHTDVAAVMFQKNSDNTIPSTLQVPDTMQVCISDRLSQQKKLLISCIRCDFWILKIFE